MDTPDVVAELASRLREHQVFGPPVTQDGVTLIPVAEVRGGGGIGGRTKPGVAGNGGFGMVAKPIGAWVINDGKVRWEPALDLNRIILAGHVVVIVALLTLRRLLRRR
jgi:uncharacterized spore protein YtfJ